MEICFKELWQKNVDFVARALVEHGYFVEGALAENFYSVSSHLAENGYFVEGA